MTLRLQNQELISRNDSLRIANKQLMRLKEDQTISIVALTATADDLSQQNAQLRNELLACRAERDEATLSPEPCSCTLADSVLSDDLDLGSDDGSDAWNETEDMRRELLETKEALTAVEATLDSVARDNKELRKELFDLRCGGSLASSREASTSTSGSWTPGRPSPFFNFFIDSAPDAESPIPPLAFELSSPSSPSFPFTPMSAAFPLTPYPPSPPIRFAARTNVSGNVRRALAARIPHSIKARKMRVLRNMDRRSRDEFI
ncbi:hypothetical protein BD410DRAFT_785274 [Rickenella mellea]|uniref:Uncharacterized protein n=1 Tax=Rickenella mellea TaxID=50990 RepID=A0A4Y7QDC5_9AGAM|nr:hypothetical protein BD410DRAFT_785274 [Rickenella mellea]